MDKGNYKKHIKNYKEKTYQLPEMCIPYLYNVFNSGDIKEYRKAIRDIPDCSSGDEAIFSFLENIFRGTYRLHTSNVDLKHGESTFNSLLLYPFIEAVADFVSENMAWSKAGFRNGEAPLVSMHKQLENTELYQNDNYNYFAYGIIKLYGLKKIEVLLLETSGSFGNTDKSKISYDHHKGLFGALVMLKNIADEFPLASMKAFQKCKAFFFTCCRKNGLSLEYEI
ncbi:hypothetical protein RO3G_09075 [Rhizopus delemar RA 99-880]|uniref:Uncharacterized protein n=1 Tax=Rhizopus delemar (strain RA 99-880 / ATCC MYA-4621 / FGSC 9543 / NRRL 43880) TaxID=246409 RepID=I1C7D5_RHIO9|nr:hypothetical protein RO3G_09075 [Rhizopus delemar RA 99-880]|eukprot:EIE84365.1 hypothetical protein RO3G_09075 [Rhizopus delemar RA 99-880]